MFLLAALDSAGIPIPGGVDALLVVLAAAAPAGAYFGAAAAIVGSAIGSMFLFYLARKGGERYLEARTASGRAARFRIWFQRYGLLTVFIPGILPVPLPLKVFVLSAGALGVRPAAFLAVILAARVPRYLGLAYLGAKVGENSLEYLKQHAWHLAAIAAALFAVLYLALRVADRIRGGRLAAEPS